MKILIILIFLNSWGKFSMACDAELLADSAGYILVNLQKPDKVRLSDIRKALNKIPSEQKIKIKLETMSGFETHLEIPNPEMFSAEINQTWLRYHLAATYVRALALGHPGQLIFLKIETPIPLKSLWEKLAVEEIKLYFHDHKETLGVKATPSTGDFQIYTYRSKIEFDQFEFVPKNIDFNNQNTHSQSESVVLGFDQGARGISVSVFKGAQKLNLEVLGEDSEELRQKDQSLHYQYTFPYGTKGGDSGEQFAKRFLNFVRKVVDVAQNKIGRLDAAYIGMPGVKNSSYNFVSLGQISRGFGDPKENPQFYNYHLQMANSAIEQVAKNFREKNIKFAIENDMTAWALAIADKGISEAVGIIAGGGQGQVAIKNGKPSDGHHEGGHQAYLPLMEKLSDYNASSPPGSFESFGLGNPGIRKYALKQSGLESLILNKFHLPEDFTLEVIHLGNLLIGKTPLGDRDLSDEESSIRELVIDKIWKYVADVEAEHILFLYLYSGQTQYVFAGGPVSGKTGEIFVDLVKEALNQKIKEENLTDPHFKILRLENMIPSDRAALAASKLL